MADRQLNFMNFDISQTISPLDPIKRIFEAMDWHEIAELKFSAKEIAFVEVSY